MLIVGRIRAEFGRTPGVELCGKSRAHGRDTLGQLRPKATKLGLESTTFETRSWTVSANSGPESAPRPKLGRHRQNLGQIRPAPRVDQPWTDFGRPWADAAKLGPSSENNIGQLEWRNGEHLGTVVEQRCVYDRPFRKEARTDPRDAGRLSPNLTQDGQYQSTSSPTLAQSEPLWASIGLRLAEFDGVLRSGATFEQVGPSRAKCGWVTGGGASDPCAKCVHASFDRRVECARPGRVWPANTFGAPRALLCRRFQLVHAAWASEHLRSVLQCWGQFGHAGAPAFPALGTRSGSQNRFRDAARIARRPPPWKAPGPLSLVDGLQRPPPQRIAPPWGFANDAGYRSPRCPFRGIVGAWLSRLSRTSFWNETSAESVSG